MASCLETDLREIVSRPLPWEQLASCRIAVTGAGGFLGHYLVRTLLALYRLGKVSRPVQVLAMVRDRDRAEERYADLAVCPELEIIPWDLNRIDVPNLGAVHYILHAASQASPRFYGTDPVGTLLPNTVGTAAMLEVLRRGGVARGFLFVSSSEVYGEVSGDVALAESDYGVVDPVAVRACYAESKRMGEAMCAAWHRQYQIPAFIARPFHTYGVGLTPEDGRVFADFAFNVARNENIVIKSDGTARRAFCYGSDAVAGFFTVLFQGTPAVPYNVANPEGELSVTELAELLVGLFPEKGLSVERHGRRAELYGVPDHGSRLVPEVSRLKALGWQAHIGPAAGFKRMIEALHL
jgi:dTDP-glucose 4,6-dehydratase